MRVLLIEVGSVGEAIARLSLDPDPYLAILSRDGIHWGMVEIEPASPAHVAALAAYPPRLELQDRCRGASHER